MEDVAIAPPDAAHPSPCLAEAGPPDGPHPALLPEADPHAARLLVRRSSEQAEQLVLDLIAAHADSLLRTARRYSLCADDAQDAYQRSLEILMRHAGRLDADRAGGWLHTVIKQHNDTPCVPTGAKSAAKASHVDPNRSKGTCVAHDRARRLARPTRWTAPTPSSREPLRRSAGFRLLVPRCPLALPREAVA